MMMEPPVPTPATSAKNLQLTPIWEQVVRNRRVPAEIGVSEILREIRSRLRAGEWEVRQHALRVLADVLSVSGPLADPMDIQTDLVSNLGSPAPGVRKAALDALSQLLKYHRNPEESILALVGDPYDDNITLGVIVALPDLLRPFILPENGGYILLCPTLVAILTFLVNKVPITIFQSASVDTLLKIRDMCGDIRFKRCLAEISPDPNAVHLLTLNLDDSGVDFKLSNPLTPEPSWSDASDGDETMANTYNNNFTHYKKSVSSEDIGSDGSDDTYTMESPGRILMETEIKLSEEKAITMRIMEDESFEAGDGVNGRFVSADGALVMSVVPSSEEDTSRRTPRRVRFGGEVIKLCTPDSDGTDVRIEIQEASGHEPQRLVISNEHRPSQIPLPVTPTTTVPFPAKNRQTDAVKNEEESKQVAQSVQNVPSIEIDTVDDVTDVTVEIPDPESSVTQLSNAPVSSNEPTQASEECYDTQQKETVQNSEKETSVSPYSENVSPETTPLFSSNVWSWESLQLLSPSDFLVLNSKVDWKTELPLLEQISRTLLTNSMVRQKMKIAHQEILRSLFRFILENTKPQNAETALCAVDRVLQIIPTSTCQVCLDDLVPGLCRHVGGSCSASTKIATASILRNLFSKQSPSDILNVLLGDRCLHSPSSKMRENSLLVLLHILMAFPSTTLPLHTVLQEACRHAADSRRRVRHAALETLAVLSQFISHKEILANISNVGDSRLVGAVSCRLTRRMLPSVSPDGLVLYALQIPSIRRLGHTGPPQGADVDWILAGTGSLSTGSARSRGQLHAAQATRWTPDNYSVRKSPRESPWTANKHRHDDGASTFTAEEDVYGDTEAGGVSAIRPYYVRLSGADDGFRSQSYALHRVADAGAVQASIRVLTPSVLRKNPEVKSSPWTDMRNHDTEMIELKRMERITGRKLPEPHRPMLMSNSPLHLSSTPPAALFLPSIESPEKFRLPSGRTQESPIKDTSSFPSPSSADKPRFVEPVLSEKLCDITGNPKTLSQSLPIVSKPLDSAKSSRNPLLPLENINGNHVKSENTLFCAREREAQEGRTMASAPAAVAFSRESSSSSSASTNLQPITTQDLGPLEVTSIPYADVNESYNQKIKAKRKLMVSNRATGKIAPAGPKFPDSLKPFDRHKEGLDMCFSQLEAPQWEVTLQGLTSLVRLVRHHPSVVGQHMHALATALSRQIRNLRSQVSRAACAVAKELFVTIKRPLEPELDELAAALFQRVADTNRFIRQDSNAALDALVDNFPPNKTVPVMLTKGMTHPNAVVKTAVARLFLCITDKLGPEKIMTLPKDIRDKMIQTGATLLTEGRLETRSFAKQLFRAWSSRPEFNTIILESIPANVMRHISKTLASLRG